ncbi:thiamine-phosphate kinase [Mangrovibacterium lignilyticum]|uniref:thiamine-phosphate kinase n=1 Tax=Mangrovibacterium lignilyticum TaxID=2668052 RepID=UPI0013D87A58|nr:thiamine-phosphate kinase [Mangrovibacterium lignilyticum]
MNTEQETIKRILNILPGSHSLSNKFFESDAEIINYNGSKLLFSIDEFSQEDFFRDDHPYKLGWNVAACTISDIFASGGKPVFYGHSISLPIEWDNEFIDSFTKGISDVLNQLSVGFIGGDIGKSASWHYTGVVIGEASSPVTRKGASEGNLIFMTGHVGAGNLEAALKLVGKNKFIEKVIRNYQLQFPIRSRESELIGQYATACIDSSDGLLNALNTIAEINHVGYKITNIPYLSAGTLACKLLGKPRTALFLGECGEYELVFTIRKSDEKAFYDRVRENHFDITKIGEIIDEAKKVLVLNGAEKELNDFNLKARNYEHIRDYVNDLTNYAKTLDKVS